MGLCSTASNLAYAVLIMQAQGIINAQLEAAGQADRKVHYRDCADYFLREDRIDEALLPNNFHLSPKGAIATGSIGPSTCWYAQGPS